MFALSAVYIADVRYKETQVPEFTPSPPHAMRVTGTMVSWLPYLTAFAVLLVLWGTGHAQNLPSIEELERRLTHTATMPDMIAYAYNENPDIAAAREAWRAKVESYRVVTGLPDPQLTATYFPEPLQTRLGPQDWNVTLSQKVPFPGKLSKAGEIVKTEAHIARLRLDKTVRTIAASIQASAHELIYIRAARQIAAQNTALLDQLRSAAETAYADDRAALLDVMKALSQSGQLRYDTLLLDELELTEITRLNGLLNRLPQAALGAIVPPPLQPLTYSLEDLYQLAAAYQEDIRIAEQGVSRAESQVDLARYHYYPDFNVGLFYASIGDPDTPQRPPQAGKDALGVRLGLTLPLWVGKNQGRVNQAHAERARAEALRQGRVNASRTDIRVAYFRLQNAQRLVELYRTDLLPQAASALETTEAWFREGYAEFTDLIEAQSTSYNFQLTLARAQADYGKHFARLEALVGYPLTPQAPPTAATHEGRSDP
jgi:outer membrane protein TolC